VLLIRKLHIGDNYLIFLKPTLSKILFATIHLQTYDQLFEIYFCIDCLLCGALVKVWSKRCKKSTRFTYKKHNSADGSADRTAESADRTAESADRTADRTAESKFTTFCGDAREQDRTAESKFTIFCDTLGDAREAERKFC
jgi:hypothetical protein